MKNVDMILGSGSPFKVSKVSKEGRTEEFKYDKSMQATTKVVLIYLGR